MARTVEVLYDGENIAKFLSSSGITIDRPASTAISSAKLHFVNREGVFSKKDIHKNLTIRIDGLPAFAGFVEKSYPRVSKRGGSVLEVVAYDFGFSDLTNTYAGLVRGLHYQDPTDFSKWSDIDEDFNPNTPPNGTVITPHDTPTFVNEVDGIGYAGDVGSIVGNAVGISSVVPRTFADIVNITAGGFLESRYTFYDDGNTGFVILKPVKVRGETGLDLLKSLCETLAVDLTAVKTPTQHDFYIEPVDLGSGACPGGELKVFPRGANDHTSSSSDPIKLIFKGAGNKTNNVVDGGIAGDSIEIKNVIVGLFPPETAIPLDGDLWTENLWVGVGVINFPGGNWSSSSGTPSIGTNQQRFNTFGTGAKHIKGVSDATLKITFDNAIDIKQKSSKAPSSTKLQFKWATVAVGFPSIDVRLTDENNNSIKQNFSSGFIGNLELWMEVSAQIFTDSLSISANWTSDGGGGVAGIFAKIDGGGFVGLKTIEFTVQAISPQNRRADIDGLHFGVFNYFSPLIVANGLSFTHYDIRKIPYKITVPVSEETALQLCISELKSRQTKVQDGTVKVKDNGVAAPVQLKVRPGDIITLDDDNRMSWIGNNAVIHTPVAGYRVANITHTITKKQGLETALKLQAWYGTGINIGTSPDTNFLSWTRLYTPYGMGLEKVIDHRLQQTESQITSGVKP